MNPLHWEIIYNLSPTFSKKQQQLCLIGSTHNDSITQVQTKPPQQPMKTLGGLFAMGAIMPCLHSTTTLNHSAAPSIPIQTSTCALGASPMSNMI